MQVAVVDGLIDADALETQLNAWSGAPAVFDLYDGDRPVRMNNTVCLMGGNLRDLGPNVTRFVIRGLWASPCGKCGSCATGSSAGSKLMGFSSHSNFVCRKCLCNAMSAATKRHCLAQAIRTDVFLNAEPVFRARLAAYRAHYDHSVVLLRPEWEKRYPINKVATINRSFVEDQLDPELWTAMLKREGGHKRAGKARIIHFQKTPNAQAVVGPRYSAFQKAVAAAFDYRNGLVASGIDVTFASGFNAQDLSAWMDMVVARGVVAFLERDGVAWDSSMNAYLCAFKANMAGIFDERLATFIRRSDHRRVSHRSKGGTMKWTIDHTVMSGAGDTSSGNSLINAAIVYEVFSRLYVRCSIIVAGDDLLVACYDDFDLETVMRMERGFGIVPEAAKFVDPMHVSFCSAIWAENERHEWKFIQVPSRVFARLFWTCRPPPVRHEAAYVRGVVKGLLPTCRNVPCVGALLRHFDSDGAVMANDKNYHFKTAAYGDSVFDDWFCKRYLVTLEAVAAFEAFLVSYSPGPGIIRHPLLDRLNEVDFCDLEERHKVFNVPRDRSFVAELGPVVRETGAPIYKAYPHAPCRC